LNHHAFRDFINRKTKFWSLYIYKTSLDLKYIRTYMFLGINENRDFARNLYLQNDIISACIYKNVSPLLLSPSSSCKMFRLSYIVLSVVAGLFSLILWSILDRTIYSENWKYKMVTNSSNRYYNFFNFDSERNSLSPSLHFCHIDLYWNWIFKPFTHENLWKRTQIYTLTRE
jgi:hypothetical protein